MQPDFEETDLAEIVAGFRASRFTRLDLRYGSVHIAIGDGEFGSAPDIAMGESADADEVVVSADLLGTFRFASGSGPAAMVSALLKPDTIIGTITVLDEAVEIRAGVGGTVRSVAVEDGEFVEYGRPLLRVKPETSNPMRGTS